MRRTPTLAAALALVFALLRPVAAQEAAPPAGQPRSDAPPARPVTVLVAYASVTGATEDMASAVEAGARTVPGTNVVRRRVADVTAADLTSADALIVGSPVHNANMLTEVAQFIERWPFDQMNDRVGAAFVAAGGTSAGEELTMMSLIAAMLVHRMVIVGGEGWEASFGASAVTYEGRPAELQGKVPENAREKARALGRRVALLTQALARGEFRRRR